MPGFEFFPEFAPKTASKPTPIMGSGCDACGLYKGCKSPKMEPWGQGQLKIAIVAEAPGEKEDELGIPLIGPSGQLLNERLKLVGDYLGLDPEVDCVKLNVVQCRPPNNREPTPDEIRCCRERVDRQLEEIQPALILALGNPAINAILADAPVSISAGVMAGRVVPSELRRCWVACSYHPAWFLRNGNRDLFLLDNAILAGLRKLEQGVWTSQLLDESAFQIVDNYQEALSLLQRLSQSTDAVGLDFETYQLHPWDPEGTVLTVGLATSTKTGWCVPVTHRESKWSSAQLEGIKRALCSFFESDAPKIIQNWQFEGVWVDQWFKSRLNNVVVDTMVREHIIDNRDGKGITSQGFQTFVRFGSNYKQMVNRKDLRHEFLDHLARYNVLDVRYMLKWAHEQDKQMTHNLEQAYSLFHRATPVMTDLKVNGIKIDVPGMKKLETKLVHQLENDHRDMSTSKWLLQFSHKQGKRYDPNSPKDKMALFYDIMNLTPLKRSAKTGDPSTDQESLGHLLTQVEEGSEEEQLITAAMGRTHIVKLLGTYVRGIMALMDHRGLVHPSFHLHRVDTYRSSSSDPNFQNIPVRNPLMAQVRRNFVPHNDWLLESDYSGAEVCVLAMYSGDPVLIQWIIDKVDFHHYWAALLYDKPEKDVTKTERDTAKSTFVFALFYGSYYKNIARSNPQWPENRVRQVEKKFWDTLCVTREWQEGLVQFYNVNNYIESKLGFRMAGPLSRNQIFNYLIQGTSFHRLLIALLDAYDALKEIRDRRSMLVGQIHDSIVDDVTEEELDQEVSVIRRVMHQSIWSWDKGVPMTTKFKAGKNLLDLKPIE
jgi:uracil-DNA glycosylase family 4